jgi:MoxR-like ATPase
MAWNFWQAPDRDSVKILEDLNVSLGKQLRLLLQMEGAKGTVDKEVQSKTGEELKRARRPHKLLERMGILYQDSNGNTRLTDLGRSLREIPETQDLRRRIAESAVPILTKYQLKNPADDPDNEYPLNTDIHPYWAIFKAIAELDWKLHWDELNRELFWILKHEDLDAAVERIRQARTNENYDPIVEGTIGKRVYDQEDAPEGKTPGGQVRDQKTTPWFRKAGFGGLLLEEPGHAGGGYWSVPNDMQPLINLAIQKKPHYYDFDNIQDWYKYYGTYETSPNAPKDIQPEQLKAVADAFSTALQEANLNFGLNHERFVRAFLASLMAKRFVILAGLSGSGKTQIAQKLGQWFGTQHYDVVPVRPDWTGSEPLLGYEDVLIQREDKIPVWSVPRVLEFCVQCRQEPLRPHLLLLDEMNLAHVEQYFADFLSGMESGEPVLPDVGWDSTEKQWILLSRERLAIPDNLFIIGTVNVDETTYMFSPKVLDRAHTIEFRVLPNDLPSDAFNFPRPSLIPPAEDYYLQAFLDTSRDITWHQRYSHDQMGAQLANDLKEFHHILLELDSQKFYLDPGLDLGRQG